jgi:peroxiredoxin
MKMQIGHRAPDFTLPSHLDTRVSLSQFRRKNVVIAFFPLAWTQV